MSRPSVKELTDRVAELEWQVAAAGALDVRLAAIERSIRSRRYEPAEFEAVEQALAGSADLVERFAPVGEPVGILADRDAELPTLVGRPSIPLLSHGSGDATGRLASRMALVEAARVTGLSHLLLPPPVPAGEDLDRETRAFLVGRFAVLADEPAGLLVRLTAASTGDGDTSADPPLSVTLDQITGWDRFVPVLDWTDLDLGSVMSGRGLFPVSAGNGGGLPYLDGSVDVVVIDDPGRVDEARRVARRATVGVRRDPSGRVAVVDVDDFGRVAEAPVIEVIAPAGAPSDLDDAIAENCRRSVPRVANPIAAAASSEADVVVILEPGVLPLSRCVDALASALASRPAAGAVTAKLLAADGTLEAAGSTVFADGSAAGVGAGCDEVAAAWHEYVRPVCTGAGLLAVRPSAARDAEATSLPGLAAALWRAAHEVLYQPDAWAVRVHAPEAAAEEAGEGRATEGWGEALRGRPQRPLRLDAAAWRELLAREDVAGSWQ